MPAWSRLASSTLLASSCYMRNCACRSSWHVEGMGACLGVMT